MNLYQLTVTLTVEAMHLFPAIMKVQDALATISDSTWGKPHVDWDRDDLQCQRDYDGAKALLAPAEEGS